MESVPVSWFMVPVFDGGRMSFTNVNYKLKYRGKSVGGRICYSWGKDNKHF